MASYGLGQTQRGIILNIIHKDSEETHPKVPYTSQPREVLTELPPDDVDHENNTNHKQCCNRVKCILLLFGLLAVFAGILVLVLLKRNPDPVKGRGIISKDEVVESECKDVLSARLNTDIILKCSIKGTILSGKVEAVHRNPALNLSKLCLPVVNGTEVTCNLGRANCSSSGEFDIKFYNGIGKDAKVMFTRQVTVTIKAPPKYPETNLIQVFSDKNTSKFRLSCLLEFDCSSYQMGFYGNNYEITDFIHCDLSYSDSTGYFINCSAEVDDKVIFKYGNGTDLTCQIKKGDSIIRKNNFNLPSCSDYAYSNTNCTTASRTLYNCANKTDNLDDCALCPVIKECSNLRYWGSGQCCSLLWCRNETTLHIDRSKQNFFDHLCSIQ